MSMSQTHTALNQVIIYRTHVNSNATALLLKIACLPQAGIEKLEIVVFSIRFIKKNYLIFQ
jgi:hypothetical protein